MGPMNKGLDIPLWVAPASRTQQVEKMNLELPFWTKPVCNGSIEDYTSIVPQHQANLPKQLLQQREVTNLRRLAAATEDDTRSEASTSPDDSVDGFSVSE